LFRQLLDRPSHATVVAYVALFVALGGTSVAAVTLKRNSVKGKNIARNAVSSPKVKDRSLLATDFKEGQLPQGPAGSQGSKGDPCAAADPACRGPQGERGSQGPGAVKIAWTAQPSTYGAQLATVGPWTITADCDPQPILAVYLGIAGPGTADYYVVRSQGDPGVDDVYARSSPTTYPFPDFSVQPSAHNSFQRAAGTLILHSGDTVAEVELHVVADERPASDVCTVYGTAIPAS
jgi:hypothetical protein